MIGVKILQDLGQSSRTWKTQQLSYKECMYSRYMIFLEGLHTCINLVSKGCRHFGQHEDAYLTYACYYTVLSDSKKKPPGINP